MSESQTKSREAGIRFRCDCGAGLLIAARYIGQLKHCPKCQTAFTVSSEETQTAKPTLSPRKPPVAASSQMPASKSTLESWVTGEATCAVCQCSLLPDEERTACSACGLPHHADCWKENFGCSAYGCSQVNALKTGPDIQIGSGMLAAPIRQPAPPPVTSNSFPRDASPPWEFAILVLSVVCFLLGVVTYGVPSILALATNLVFISTRNGGFDCIRKGRVNWNALVPAGLISWIGIAVGIMSSSRVYAP